MLLKKYGHGLRSAKGQIYSIGVCVENATKDCEKYSILHDKWKGLPNLNQKRYYMAAFVFGNDSIYALAGYTGRVNINSMERMNILSPLRWDKIEISNSFSVRRSIHAIEIGPNEVLVFGSRVTRNTMIFQPKNTAEYKKG